MGKNQKEASFGQGLGLGITMLKALAAAGKKYDVGLDDLQRLIENENVVYECLDRIVQGTRPLKALNERRLFVGPFDRHTVFAPFGLFSEAKVAEFLFESSKSDWSRHQVREIEFIDAKNDARFFENQAVFAGKTEKIALTIREASIIWGNLMWRGSKQYSDLNKDVRLMFIIKTDDSSYCIEMYNDQSGMPQIELLTGPQFEVAKRIAVIPKLSPGKKVVREFQSGRKIYSQSRHSMVHNYDIQWLSVDKAFDMDKCVETKGSDFATVYDLAENVYSWTEVFYDICPEFNRIALTINEALALNMTVSKVNYTTAFLVEQDEKYFVLELKDRGAYTGKIYDLKEGGTLNVNGKHRIVTRSLIR